MFELVDFRHCDFTIAALSLTFLYAILLGFVGKYGFKLYRDAQISHRVMKSCLLSFLAAVCIARIIFFVGWTFDGPQCYPTMIQKDDKWVSYFSNIPATLFVTAFSILVTSFATVFHYHVQTAENNRNIRYHKVVVTFMWLTNIGLYFFLFGSLVSMFVHSTDLWFQKVLVLYVLTSSSVMALLFLFYGIVLYTSVGHVLKSKALHEVQDYASLDLLADSPHSGPHSARFPSRQDSVQRAHALSHADAKSRKYTQTPSHGPFTLSSPTSQARSDDGQSKAGSESSPPPTVGLPHVSSYGPSQLRSLTQSTQEARAKLNTRKTLTVNIPGCSRQKCRISDGLRANSIAGTDSYGSMQGSSSGALISGSGSGYGTNYHAGAHANAYGNGLVPTHSDLTNTSSNDGVEHPLDVPMSHLPLGGAVGGKEPVFPLLGTAFHPGGGYGVPSGRDGLPSPTNGQSTGDLRPIGVNAMPWGSMGAGTPKLMHSVSSDHLYRSRSSSDAVVSENPMENMFRISLISGVCLFCRVGMLLYMNLIAVHQGPIVIIIYSLLSEIVPVHLILRVFNDASTSYTRENNRAKSPTNQVDNAGNGSDVSGYVYRRHTEELLADENTSMDMNVSLRVDVDSASCGDQDGGDNGDAREHSVSRVSVGSHGYRPPDLDDSLGVCV